MRLEIRKSVRKRAQQILKKYSSLPLSVRRGRQKSDWHYRTRVGKKASELRKVKFASCRRIRLKLQHTQAAQKPASKILLVHQPVFQENMVICRHIHVIITNLLPCMHLYYYNFIIPTESQKEPTESLAGT